MVVFLRLAVAGERVRVVSYQTRLRGHQPADALIKIGTGTCAIPSLLPIVQLVVEANINQTCFLSRIYQRPRPGWGQG